MEPSTTATLYCNRSIFHDDGEQHAPLASTAQQSLPQTSELVARLKRKFGFEAPGCLRDAKSIKIEEPTTAVEDVVVVKTEETATEQQSLVPLSGNHTVNTPTAPSCADALPDAEPPDTKSLTMQPRDDLTIDQQTGDLARFAAWLDQLSQQPGYTGGLPCCSTAPKEPSVSGTSVRDRVEPKFTAADAEDKFPGENDELRFGALDGVRSRTQAVDIKLGWLQHMTTVGAQVVEEMVGSSKASMDLETVRDEAWWEGMVEEMRLWSESGESVG